MIKLLNTSSIVQSYLENWISEDMIAVDMTVGNGLDSEFLLNQKIHFLYGFDIQKEALEAAYHRLEKLKYSNYQFFHSSHDEVDLFIDKKIDLFVYNLGYLPGGDKSITTNGKTVIESLKKSLNLLRIKGMIWITFYPGHSNGFLEAELILEYLKSLDQKEFHVLKFEYINQKNNPPYLIALEKV